MVRSRGMWGAIATLAWAGALSCQALLNVDFESKDTSGADASQQLVDAPTLESGDAASLVAGPAERLIDGQLSAQQLAINSRGLFWVDGPHTVRGLCPTGGFACNPPDGGGPAECSLGTATPRGLTALNQKLVYLQGALGFGVLDIEPLAYRMTITLSTFSSASYVGHGDEDKAVVGGTVNASPDVFTRIEKFPSTRAQYSRLVYSAQYGVLSGMAVAHPNVAYLSKSGVIVASLLTEGSSLERWASDGDGILIAGVSEGVFAFATASKQIRLATAPGAATNDAAVAPGALVTTEDRIPTALAANEKLIAWTRREPNQVTLYRLPITEGRTPLRIAADAETTSLALYGGYVYWTTAQAVFRAKLPD